MCRIMKLVPVTLFVFVIYCAAAQQQQPFYLQGQFVDANQNPVSDVYIFNLRNGDKNVSKGNGVFDVHVLPSDSLIASHISFLRKVITVFDLMKNPVIQLNLDTLQIKPVNVSAKNISDYEKAKKNIESIGFDFKPLPTDIFSESERVNELMKTENRVHRVAASSVVFARFSPSEQIGKFFEIRKRKKEARQFSSTKYMEMDMEK